VGSRGATLEKKRPILSEMRTYSDHLNQYTIFGDRESVEWIGRNDMVAVRWRQVHAWRLAQHGLAPRFSAPEYLHAVTRTGGIQAQVMSAAELAVCTRVEGLTPRDVQAALWQDRTLVKTWAMRGTLHLLAARELPLYVAARDWQLTARWSRYFAEFGLSLAQQEAYLAAIPHVLEQHSLTRQQLAGAVAQHTGVARMRDLIVSSSWGAPLKPSAYRGELCIGPSQGQSVTYMNPRVWMEDWPRFDPQLALQELARRYLQAYGPATTNDFAFWWGCTKGEARKLFHAMAAELEEVEVEGWRAFALRATLPFLQSSEPVGGIEDIHLLPLFDAYTIGAPRDCEPLLAPAYKRQVFNLQGWTFAVVLVNGSIQGVWRSTSRRAQTVLQVNLFSASTAAIRQGIAAEAERLSHLLGRAVVLEYA